MTSLGTYLTDFLDSFTTGPLIPGRLQSNVVKSPFLKISVTYRSNGVNSKNSVGMLKIEELLYEKF
jgi:hypothetical protein